MGCHACLQGIFPTQGSNSGVPHCSQVLAWRGPLCAALRCAPFPHPHHTSCPCGPLSQLPFFPIHLYPVHDSRNRLPQDPVCCLNILLSGLVDQHPWNGRPAQECEKPGPPSKSGRFLFTKHCTVSALASLPHTLMAARRPTPRFSYRSPTSVLLPRPLLRTSSKHPRPLTHCHYQQFLLCPDAGVKVGVLVLVNIPLR